MPGNYGQKMEAEGEKVMLAYLSMIERECQKTRFEAIYWENRTLMFVQARRVLHDVYLAEDAVHDAFMRIAENMDTVERLNDCQVKRYVMIAAKHAAIDLWRKRSKQMEYEISYEEMALYAEAERKETNNEVLEMLLELPDQYRDVFLLKYSVGLTNEEIGTLLSLTVSGVKQRITRGKAVLREKLKEGKCHGNQ